MGGKKRAKIASPLNSSSSSSASPQKTEPDDLSAAEREHLEKFKASIFKILDENFREAKKQLTEILWETITDLKRKLKEANEWIDAKSKEDNKLKFVINGFAESEKEDAMALEKKVKDVLIKKMKFSERDAADMISGTSRMGKITTKPAQNQSTSIQRPRPVLLKLLRDKHRNIFIGRLSSLHDTSLRVSSYLTKEERKNKNILMMRRRQEIINENKVKMIGDNILQVEAKDKKTGVTKIVRYTDIDGVIIEVP